MIHASESFMPLRRTTLRALMVVGLLLVGQFSAILHEIDHDSRRGDCVVCRVSESGKHAAATCGSAGNFLQSPLLLSVLAPEPENYRFGEFVEQRERAPPISS